MKKPTEKQIEKEIATLIKMKPNVRRSSIFGDDHWAAIDEQITVLTKRMSQDEVYDTYASENYKENVFSAADDASRWMAGEEDMKSPSNNWKELVQK